MGRERERKGKDKLTRFKDSVVGGERIGMKGPGGSGRGGEEPSRDD